MSNIRVSGTIRQIVDTSKYNHLLIVELGEESKTKLRHLLDTLQGNNKYIHSSGSFAFKITSKTKFTYTSSNASTYGDNIADLVGLPVDVTSQYKRYRFKEQGSGELIEGYSFVAIIVRV